MAHLRVPSLAAQTKGQRTKLADMLMKTTHDKVLAEEV